MIVRGLILRSGVSGGSPPTPTPLKHSHGICQLLLADATRVIKIKLLQAATTDHCEGSGLKGRGGGLNVKEGN